MSSERYLPDDVESDPGSSFASTLRRLQYSPTALIGLVIISLLITLAVFSAIDSFLFNRAIIRSIHIDPHAVDVSAKYAEPSAEHPLGTDRFGRDVLARLIYGSRTALSIGIIAVGISSTTGVVIGVVSAYFGGYVDDALMRLVEVLWAIPALVLAMIFLAIFGANIYNLFIAYGITGIPAYARLMRSEALSLRDRQFVEAAKLAGLPRRKILLREIASNGIAPVIVSATLSMGSVIIGAAALSFLGFGVQPPTADWGRMLSDGRAALLIAWWVAFFPGLMIFLTVMGFNMLGDGLRDILDPKLTLQGVESQERDIDAILEESTADETRVTAEGGGRQSAQRALGSFGDTGKSSNGRSSHRNNGGH